MNGYVEKCMGCDSGVSHGHEIIECKSCTTRWLKLIRSKDSLEKYDGQWVLIENERFYVPKSGLLQTYTAEWIECPLCGIENYIFLGDLNDLSKPDVDAIKCWNCKKSFFLTNDEDMIGQWIEGQMFVQENGSEKEQI